MTGAMLVEARMPARHRPAALKDFGDGVLRTLWESIDAHPPIGEDGPVRYLGIAHGWAGFLYATLQWCDSSGIDLPTNTGTRLRRAR